jgi:dTDP-4-dehydrorhamnose 3,5-epimerase-like enzyme
MTENTLHEISERCGAIDLKPPVLCSIPEAPHVGARNLIPADRDYVVLASGARLQRIPQVNEPRGRLVFAEMARHLPFEPKRFFAVFDVPEGEIRGCHAHHHAHEFLISLRGAWTVSLDDGRTQQTIVLETPDVGLHIPPKVWRSFYRQGPDALIVSLSSDVYRADDYIRDYQVFVRMPRAN